ncbi:MAG: hypothetical protein WBQ64_04630 [Terriglobales bacterium]
MLLGCVVGVGFMVRFLVALTRDGKMRSEHTIRQGGLRYAEDASRLRARHRGAVASSASHLAIGVVRITTALTWNSDRPRETPGRLHVVTAGKTDREVDAPSERRYRSG